ncbi:leucine-rich repeat domain-containing protein [Mycolicibacterium bacteremicum]|uniref:leucine-rich repeat domain-containing protein n=1 Tax=Mycolicibacterium bacteremicum TaxID=564198 RepID=UPI0026F1B8DD|nr:hypothetical protein [Mycolicibacterium bacteremicum]
MTTATEVALRTYRHNFWGVDQFVGDNLDSLAHDKVSTPASASIGRYVRHPDFRIDNGYLPILIDALNAESITALSLASCRRLTGPGIAALAAFPAATFLDLFNTNLTDADLAILGDLRELEVLNLAGTAITGELLGTLAGLPKLRTLHLGFTDITPQSLPVLANSPNLTTLNVVATATGDAEVGVLAAIASLTELGLDETRITDRAVAEIRASGAHLTRLQLGYTAVTDECVADLCALGSLTHLQLRATHIDRAHESTIVDAVAGLHGESADGMPRVLW